jgi:cyclopropane-fatty-acyl-phospholipid synthase
MVNAVAKRAFLGGLRQIDGGLLRVHCTDGTYEFGRPSRLDAALTVHDDRFFRRALTGADIGIGESFMDGDWSTPDLVTLTRLMLRNRSVLDRRAPIVGAARSAVSALARRLRDNTRSGSRRHIRRHYDLGNDFFGLFLDSALQMYSSAYFESPDDTLEVAQTRKVERLCRLLDLAPADRVLEIGSGWGGFARWAAGRYGCPVTTTTISAEQYRHIRAWQSGAGEAGARVEALRADYRDLQGQFDKIVSIEMFEAVGLGHYDDYFSAVDRLLTPDGVFAMQTITVSDQWFPRYHGAPDWLEAYIFPGGELAAIGPILQSVARVTSLSLYSAESFGTHYARTLRLWRERFHARRDAVRSLGFDERFVRMWDFYLAICEAAFLERHTQVFQLLFVKNGSSRQLFNEPWSEQAAPFAAPATSAA